MNPSKAKNRRIPIMVLVAVLLGVVLSHLSIKSTENGMLLVVDEREMDALGNLQNRWTSLTSSCDSVQMLHPEDDVYQEALMVLKAYSPPQSHQARVASVWQMGDWLLVESEFIDLLPAVVPLQRTGGGLQIVPEAVWSGYTLPWKAAPFIRQYIQKQSPQTPKSLLNCFEPQSQGFQ